MRRRRRRRYAEKRVWREGAYDELGTSICNWKTCGDLSSNRLQKCARIDRFMKGAMPSGPIWNGPMAGENQSVSASCVENNMMLRTHQRHQAIVERVQEVI